MRQGEIGLQGKWKGSATGGVKAPEAILLPDPNSRFAATASRLQALAAGHPMAGWLSFMAQLAQAQHVAATALPLPSSPDASLVARCVEARMPPLAADGHRRDPLWRDALRVLLERCDSGVIPPQAQAVIADLRARDAEAMERAADRFLHGEVEPADAGALLYVAAALQVYFTKAAAALRVTDLRLLPQRGLCPCCGSTPVAGLVTATGQTPGVRYLQCSLCSTQWNHVRAVCITCGGSRAIGLEGIEGDAGIVRAETCGDCHTYSKVIYQAEDMGADPSADDLASIGLDVLLAGADWARHAPNPLLLVG